MVSLDCAVVVVSYNCRELLLRCLGALAREAPGPAQVVVVDNASTDGTPAAVASRHPGVDLLALPRNLGFARATNAGIARTRAGTVVLLNPDTEVRPGALGRLLAFLAAHPDAGAVGPRLVLPDGRLDRACRRGLPTPANAFWYYTGLSRLFPRSRALAGYQLTYLPEDQDAAVGSLCGAAMAVPRRVLDQVGLLDEQFFLFGEDIDWCYRIQQAGYRVYYHPAAAVLHQKGGSGRSPRVRYEFYRAMYLYFRKHYGGWRRQPLGWLVMAGIALLGAGALAAAGVRWLLAPGAVRAASRQEGGAP